MNRSQELFVYALMLITSISIVYGLTNVRVIEVPTIIKETEIIYLTEPTEPNYKDNIVIFIEDGNVTVRRTPGTKWISGCVFVNPKLGIQISSQEATK